MLLNPIKTRILLFLGLIILISMSCSSKKNSSSEDLSNRIYLIQSITGSLEPTTNAKEFVVTLDNVPDEVHWMTDQPTRLTGTDTPSNFIENNWTKIFASTAPNAILKFLLEDEDNTVFLTLNNPLYNAETKTLSFTATLLHSTFEETDPRLQDIMEFTHPTLVILNNYAGLYFTVHSETTTLENTGPDKTTTLIQNNVADKILWANSAPSTTFSESNLEEFANIWKDAFTQVLPNAYLFGTTNEGELKTYSITLESLEYSPGSTEISYIVSNLDTESITDITLNSATLIIDSIGSLLDTLALAHNFGASIKDRTRLAMSFKGIPATTKSHDFVRISEDVICRDAEVPLSKGNNIIESTTGITYQEVILNSCEIQDVTEWIKISHKEPAEANSGIFSISVYSMLTSGDYVQIFFFSCNTAFVTNYEATTGNIQLLCTNVVQWVMRRSKVNPDWTDASGNWDLSP